MRTRFAAWAALVCLAALVRPAPAEEGLSVDYVDLPTPVATWSRARNPEGLLALAATAAAPGQPRPANLPARSIVPLQELERQAIQHALVHTRGDRTTAAQLLGIGRTTLYRKLKEYEIE